MTNERVVPTTTRRPIPYEKLVKMLTSGKSYKEIAIALQRYDDKSPDPTKPIRAIVSRMKTVGYMNQKGEFGKLKIGKKKAGRPTEKEAKPIREKPSKPKAIKSKAFPTVGSKTEPQADQA